MKTAKQSPVRAKRLPAKTTLPFWKRPALCRVLVLGALPVASYFVMFCVFTWPWISHFNGWFFTDSGDGLQNVWNIWWVDKSVTVLHQLPWHTSYLHAPEGVSLLGQTLNPFNGFVATGLLSFMSLTQAFNTMIIFSFVMAGLTAFWLCYYFTKAHWASLVGGFIFTFSSYHFAHAIGHMQLVSLEWIPLFILFWWKLLKKPTYLLGAAASLTLLLTLWCDYYYFLYSIVTAVAIAIYLWRKGELTNLRQKRSYRSLGLFLVISLVLVAPLPIALLRLNSSDILIGSHEPRIFSTDLFSPFIDGGFWRFHNLTNAYWRHIAAFTSESSIYLGLSVIAVLFYGLRRRKKLPNHVNFWLGMIIVFGIFSLGPRLMVRGISFNHAPLPYALLERIFPQIKLSGVPIRMMVMVTLGAAVVSAMVFSQLKMNLRKHQAVLLAFVLILSFEVWPLGLPFTSSSQPKYVMALQKLPATGAVLDNAAKSEPYQLYHQTSFDKPIVLGYISRTPQDVVQKDAYLVSDITLRHYAQLCPKYKLRYITVPTSRPLQTTFPVIYKDNQALIYDLKNSSRC